MEAFETIHCKGDRHIRGSHRTTFEVTTDPHLTYKGDCIIGICADKGAADLDTSFKKVLKRDDSFLITRLSVQDCTVEVHSRGSSRLTLADDMDHVWRKSQYVCDRTIGICSDYVAATLPRQLVKLLQAGNEMTVEMVALTLETVQ